MADSVRVGVVGCGNISSAYLGMAKKFPVVEIVACADLVREVAEAKAEEFEVPRVLSVDDLVKDPSVDIVLNLTIPKAHTEIALRALEAGKHAYSEKPLGIDREDGRKVIETGRRKNLRVGCAPDTFMGAGLQTARKLIEDGAIGKPIAFTAFMMSPGPEGWHPSPEFLFEKGGGPMLDMGPYYLTAFNNLFGPIKRLTGTTSFARPQRVIGSGPKKGKAFNIETPDFVCGTIEYENGAAGTIVTTYATHHATYDHKQPITVYGTEGTMKVPDPNNFDSPVSVRLAADQEWKDVPFQFVTGYGRSIGLADMAQAIKSGRKHRANGEQAFAVLDAMIGFLDSARDGKAFTPTARCERPAPMRADLPFGVLDE